LSAYSEEDAAAAKTADAVYNAIGEDEEGAEDGDEDAEQEHDDAVQKQEEEEGETTTMAADYDDNESAGEKTAAPEEGYDAAAVEGDNEAAASTVATKNLSSYGSPPFKGTGSALRGRLTGSSDSDLAAEAAAAAHECPGGSLTDCVDVCPGSSAKIYAACVHGCGNRCPT
jgi:hypothetical protein